MTTADEPEDSRAPLPRENGDRDRQGFLISGRVQGVGFRHWTVRNARMLDLRGTVRNRPDGKVEIHAQGRPADLSELAERLRTGPRAARVQGVEEIPPREDLPRDFRVVY